VHRGVEWSGVATGPGGQRPLVDSGQVGQPSHCPRPRTTHLNALFHPHQHQSPPTERQQPGAVEARARRPALHLHLHHTAPRHVCGRGSLYSFPLAFSSSCSVSRFSLGGLPAAASSSHGDSRRTTARSGARSSAPPRLPVSAAGSCSVASRGHRRRRPAAVRRAEPSVQAWQVQARILPPR
jgi:hypothetical protein